MGSKTQCYVVHMLNYDDDDKDDVDDRQLSCIAVNH